MPGVVLLTGTGDTAARVRQVVRSALPDVVVVIARPRSRLTELRARIGRHGAWKAFGQVAFRALLANMLKRSRKRIDAIWRDAGAAPGDCDPRRVRYVADINGAESHAILKAVRPEVAIVFSGRRLSAETIAACGAPILNLHPGITPRYRGSHNGYWALRNADAHAFGATVHLVDEGLDTGPIVEQILCSPGRSDNVATYTALITARGLPVLIRAVSAARSGEVVARPSGAPSPIFHEPTIWDYLIGGFRTGVW